MMKYLVLMMLALSAGCSADAVEAPGSSDGEEAVEATASAMNTADLAGYWKGYNCEGEGKALENIVYLHVASDGLTGTVRYYYPGLNSSCYSDLSLESSVYRTSTWADETLTSGCIDGLVTMRAALTNTSMTYTWDDPTGRTSSCTGTLTKY